jgi:phosphinothricin acetyltransferase
MQTIGHIRLATHSDIPIIVDIYNQGIRNRNNALLDEIVPDEYAIDFQKRDLKEYPIYVYETGTVLGWISISPYRANRRAYRKTKEVSFYIDSQHHSKGIGSQLLNHVIENRENINFISLFAILVANNDKSVLLLKKYGFSLWGFWPKVLDIDGEYSDAIIYGRNFL